jgi:hypothetical protein
LPNPRAIRFNYRHPHIPAGLESELIVRAFERDFAVNGPSMLRVVQTTLTGWRRYKSHADQRIRRRFAWEVKGMATTYSAVVAAAKRYTGEILRCTPGCQAFWRIMYREFGWTSRVSAANRRPCSVEDPAGGAAAWREAGLMNHPRSTRSTTP